GKETEEERKNEQLLQEYLSYGMSETSIFEYDDTRSGRRTKRKRISGAFKKPLDLFDGLNFAVEQTPRFAVYLETVDRLTRERDKGRNEYTDEDIKTIAVYRASDATLNFGRSGTVVKNLNTYGCTFLNAGVQGLDRFRRMFTQVKDGNKRAIIFNVIGLGVKLGLIGLTPGILSDILYGDDDDEGWKKAVREFLYGDDAEKIAQEYAEMADYQKENYFLFNIGGKWIRIPKGRVLAFIQSFKVNGTKVHEKEMDALDLVIAQLDMASETIMFSNPVTSNIFGPMIEVWNNKDHWGNEIVSEYEDMGEGFHYLEYDEETSKLAIKIAEFGHYLTADVMGREESRLLDFSPKKLDHLIQQYLGSYSNLIVPFLSGNETMSEKAMDALMSIAKKFYVDPTTSNRLAGDYYDMKEKYENISNAHDGDTPYAVVDYVFKDYNEQLKLKREEISVINANENLTREEKLKKISALKAEMNELYRQGIADAESLLSYAHANYYGKEGNRELYDSWMKNNKGAEWQISTMSDSAQAKWQEVSKSGVSEESFVGAYDFFSGLTADKDENGKSIPGSKQEKFITYLNSLPETAEQKVEMFYTIGGYSRNKEAPQFVDGEYKQPMLTSMSSPLSSGGRLSSGYGWRTCPFHGREFHEAVDIAADYGTDIGAALSGTVTMAASSNGFGNTVEITSTDENGNTIVTKYNHMANFGVEVGDVVNQGTKIGEVGSTGSSTGPHLDFRLKINGEWVDPEDYLDLTAAGVVNGKGYTQKAASGGTASGGYSSASSGGSSGGSKSGGSSGRTDSGSRRTSGSYTASTGNRSSSSGSGSSGGSSGGVTLPTASQLSAITARSTKAPTYAKGGVTLPTAKELSRIRDTTIAANKSGRGTPRTGTTSGARFWDENVLG
ncbi:MAG: peptidoglycan DD-metalloendopeptidase family protein, partial [Clostridia bacterium]